MVNQIQISTNPIILAIKFLPLTVKIVLTVPSDTSKIRAKKILKHNNIIVSPTLSEL